LFVQEKGLSVFRHTIFEAKLLESVPLIPHSLGVNAQDGSDLPE
jgi:hypothetical protein